MFGLQNSMPIARKQGNEKMAYGGVAKKLNSNTRFIDGTNQQRNKYSNKHNYTKKNENTVINVKSINSVFDIEPPKVNEDHYKVVFKSHLYKETEVTPKSFEIESIQKREVCKLLQPLRSNENERELSADPAIKIIKKHESLKATLTFGRKYLDPETLEISSYSSDDSINQSFTQTLKNKFTKDNEFFTPAKSAKVNKMKKPKILKSDGKTVTAESVMRMVDASFLVNSDVDDSSMISMNNSNILGGGGAALSGLKLTNLLDDLNKVDPIDKVLTNGTKKTNHNSIVRSSLSKGYNFEDFNLFETEPNKQSPLSAAIW